MLFKSMTYEEFASALDAEGLGDVYTDRGARLVWSYLDSSGYNAIDRMSDVTDEFEEHHPKDGFPSEADAMEWADANGVDVSGGLPRLTDAQYDEMMLDLCRKYGVVNFDEADGGDVCIIDAQLPREPLDGRRG